MLRFASLANCLALLAFKFRCVCPVFFGRSLLFYKNNEFVIEAGKTVSVFFSDAQVRGDFMLPTNMARGVQFIGSGTLNIDGKYNMDESKFEGVTLVKK